MHDGYEKWPGDVRRCVAMRVGNRRGSGCGTYIKVYPWNKPYTPVHPAVNWTVRNLPFTRGLTAGTNAWLGYERPRPRWKWWHDREEVDGRLRAAGSAPAKGVDDLGQR
jgi:hypothetical protein